MTSDRARELQDQMRAASADARPVALVGHGSKSFLGRAIEVEPLCVAGHAGIVGYQPRELVISARGGTPLSEIEATLAEQGQMLPFEPPHFHSALSDHAGSTLAGTIASGLSGPARAYAGAARDLVLGVRLLNGRAEMLRFGGEVMKNVAGYDVSRLMVGAMGTLGVLLEVSLKVMPIPATTATLVRECPMDQALESMLAWSARPLPLSATCFEGGRLWVRLSGTAQGVTEAVHRLGGEPVDPQQADTFWRERIRDQRHDFFVEPGGALWRLSVPASAPPLDLGRQLIEWGGALRWLRSDADERLIRECVSAVGGHAMRYRGGDRTGLVLHPLPDGLMRLHRRVKQALDPQGILNPGRLYPGV